jgi:hypothetical protein
MRPATRAVPLFNTHSVNRLRILLASHYVPEDGVDQMAQRDVVRSVVDVDVVMKGPDEQILGQDSSGLKVQEVVGIVRRGAGDLRAGSGHQNRVRVNIGNGGAGRHLFRVTTSMSRKL